MIYFLHSGDSRRRKSVIPQTPDVLKHKPRSRGRTRSRQDSNFRHALSRSNSRAGSSTGNTRSSKTWYQGGFPALRVADKKIKAIRARQESQGYNERRTKQRSRSYSRGRSVYSGDNNVPYYRSRSVDRINFKTKSFVPITNEHDVINVTYTGRTSRENSSVSMTRGNSRGSVHGRRGSGIVLKKVESVVPHLRDSYEFDDLQTRIYQQIQKLYGQPDADVKHKQFFSTLDKIQADHKRINKMKISDTDKKFLDKMFQAFQQLKAETGKILKNTTRRYSQTNKQAGSLNQKLLMLPPSRKNEDFLHKLPKTKEKLKLKPLKTDSLKKPQFLRYRSFNKYDGYDFDRIHKDPKKEQAETKHSDMLKFLQRAERMLTKYSEEQNAKTLKTKSVDLPPRKTSRLSSISNYRTGHHSASRINRVYENRNDQAPFGWLSPMRRTPKRLSPIDLNRPQPPTYVRPEAFYNPRAHLYHNNRSRLLGHRLSESRRNDNNLFGMAK
ncbi:hypothetical protein ACF0H5_009289 [Mactra antiquata]